MSTTTKTQKQAKPPTPPQPTPSERLRLALAEPFHPDEINWKPQTVKGNRALAVAYLDARAVMDRLDDVAGPLGWQDDYEAHADGSVTCRLSIRDAAAGEWVTKQDVGGESEQPDAHDRRKAAYSDALKRAGVRWGIGRYLYHLPKQWCDYDPTKKQFVRTPTLPDWAKPGAKTPPPPPPPSPPEEAAPAPAPSPPPPTPKGSTPEGLKFMAGLKDYDEELVGRGLPLAGGDLIAFVVRRGKEAQFPADVVAWGAPQLAVARGWIKECEKELSRVRIAALLAETGWTLDDVRVEIELPDDATPANMTLAKLRETIGLLEGAVVEAG